MDKGTLDAMLPEDDAANIEIIKGKYFAHIEQSLKENGDGSQNSIVIISLLQPFVLRTIL